MADSHGIWYQGLFVATFAVVLLQHAINLFNDVSDWKLGADTEKLDSWVRVHHENTRPVLIHGVISFICGGVLGMSVLVYAEKLWLLLIAVPLIWLGYLYNAGERPLSYTWMGEWVTGICYGGVFGCLWLVAGLQPGFVSWFGVGAFAALATSLLLSHQPSQIATDKQAGKHSFAVRYGKQKTQTTSLLLFVIALGLVGAGIVNNDTGKLFQYVYLSLTVFAVAYLFKLGVNPKRVLLSASSILFFSWVYRLVF